MTADPDDIANVVLSKFSELPRKRKPQVRDNGLHEWVPLSGIVAEHEGSLKCLSVATGMKCLPTSKLPQAQGNGIHDWHAEVLALRACNHFLLAECFRLAQNDDAQSWILRRRTPEERSVTTVDGTAPPLWEDQPFTLKEDVILHMYCSEAPCGDASMELTMAAQEDASPWDLPSAPPAPPAQAATGHDSAASTEKTSTTAEPSPNDGSKNTQTLLGRGYFSQLGVVRRKPARADAPPTMSKSCSDKMALRQCTSLLSSLVALFVHPRNAYLGTVILPRSQLSESGCERSFSSRGRMKSLVADGEGRWNGGYAFKPFEVRPTSVEFEFSRRSVDSRSEKTAASNLAVAWDAAGLEEGLVNGVIQGRRAFEIKGASLVSRRKMWVLAREIAGSLRVDAGDVGKQLAGPRFADAKAGKCSAARWEVKRVVKQESLSGWVSNTGDDGFQL